MKLKKTTWKTDDTCQSCGHDGMYFHYERQEIAPELYDEGETIVFIGQLFCPNCPAAHDADLELYQIPKDCIESESC